MTTAAVLRPATANDLPFLVEMMVEAAFWSPSQARPAAELTALPPPVAAYLAGWRRPGDAGLVAEVDGRAVGAAWYRCLPATAPGYGFVAEDVPEIAIAVVAASRGGGIGTALLGGLLRLAASQGLRALSLSVNPANPALRLYRRAGFREVGKNGTSLTMVHALV